MFMIFLVTLRKPTTLTVKEMRIITEAIKKKENFSARNAFLTVMKNVLFTDTSIALYLNSFLSRISSYLSVNAFHLQKLWKQSVCFILFLFQVHTRYSNHILELSSYSVRWQQSVPRIYNTCDSKMSSFLTFQGRLKITFMSQKVICIQKTFEI